MKPDGPTAQRIHLFAVRPPGRSGRDSDGDSVGGRVFGRVRRVAGMGSLKGVNEERHGANGSQKLERRISKKNQYSGLTGGSA